MDLTNDTKKPDQDSSDGKTALERKDTFERVMDEVIEMAPLTAPTNGK